MASKRIENVVEENETGFYTFNQNNSGGSFVRDSDVDHYVVIEGRSISEVIERAKEVGIYFNGCDEGYDCSCCGDRWSEPWDNEKLTKVPTMYGEDSIFAGPFYDKRKKNDTVVVHYLDGTRAYGTSKVIGWDDKFPDLALHSKVNP